MKLSEHADHTEKVVGVRAEDIHKWIDGLFDLEGFDSFIHLGRGNGFDPYSHRKYRHCIEALEDAYKEFEGEYTREQIKGVFETHLKDDYHGYIPVQKDFEDGKFKEKYHESDDHLSDDRILSKTELSEYFEGKMDDAEKSKKLQKRGWGMWISILVPTVVAIVLFVVSIFLLIIPQFEANLVSQKKLMIKELTASVVSVIDYHIRKVASGEMTEIEAKRQAAKEISALRYGKENKDYFWITDSHPKMVMHPYRPDLVGSDLSNYSDNDNKSGKLLFVEFAKLVEEKNEGYLEYFWQRKDDASRVVPKLSYVRGIEEWKWIVGTGVYLSDVDHEIAQLSHKILTTFTFITLGLVVLLFYIARQSLKIDQKRLRAETGLLEAKERYRALVEASNEGYVLELDGKHIYCNSSFQKLTGFSEEEALAADIWDKILPPLDINAAARENLQRVFQGETVRGEVEARFVRQNEESYDAVIRISRIFFSRKNGHVISIRPIVKQQTPLSIIPTTTADFEELLSELKSSKSEGHMVRVLNQLSTIIALPIENDIQLSSRREAIADVYHSTVQRLIELETEQHPEDTPSDFSFFSLGSAARKEMTLFSDQDSALVFSCTSEQNLENLRLKFLQFTNRVCQKLNASGYPFCHGGIMAANPQWCLSEQEWKENVQTQIREAKPESIRNINIFFDLHHIYGTKDLLTNIQNNIFDDAEAHPQLFKCYAYNFLQYKIPLSPTGSIRTENHLGMASFNLKDCLNLIELITRIYALKNRVTAISTIDRLEELGNSKIFTREQSHQLIDAFNYFWKLRYNHQLVEHANLRKVNDILHIKSVDAENRSTITKHLGIVAEYQSKISYDFIGVDPQIAGL